MHRLPLCIVIVCVCALLVAGGDAFAQANLPTTVAPGQIERRLQPSVPPRSALEEVLPAVPKERLPPTQAEKIHFTLSRLDIIDATVYGAPDLLPLYQPYLGKRVSVADLYKIADAITVKYRNDGYILSRAFVPEQRLKDGSARIEVIEGYVDALRFNGRPPGREGLFSYYTEQITHSRPLQLAVLERYLLLAGDLAGANVRSVFEPSATNVRAATLVVIFAEKQFDLQGGLDNRGTRTLGPLELSAGAGANDILGIYDRTAFNFLITPQAAQELQYYNLVHEETLDGEGTKAALALTYVRTHPGDILSPLDVEGRDTTVAFNLSHPFIRSRNENLSGSLSFRWEDVTTDELGARAADDRVRSLILGGSYDFSDAWRGINQFLAAIHQGLPIFDATTDGNALASRPGADTTFTKLTFNASRQQELGQGFSVVAQGAAQYSFNPLVISEQFAYGGEPFGRAYDPSELTGDSGVEGSLELDFAPGINDNLFRSAVLFGFYDAGLVYDRIHPGTNGYAFGTSAGVGVRLTPVPWLFGSVEADKPLTRMVAAESSKDWRFFFRLSVRY